MAEAADDLGEDIKEMVEASFFWAIVAQRGEC